VETTRFETIRYERRGHIGRLTLARPEKRNALNPRMWGELAALGEQLSSDGTLRCLIVAGAGESFSAGMDLVEGIGGPLSEIAAGLAENPGDEALVERGLKIASAFEWIPRLRCPSIAAVRGHALGAGLQLALACDFRIFSETARAGLPETRYGLLPDMGATFRLPRLVGESRARRLILLGDTIDADEAAHIGLADRVVPNDTLDTAATDLAGRLASLSPLALTGARRAIDAGRRLPPEPALRMAVEAQARCLGSPGFTERAAAAKGLQGPT
jgi:enoyl-CoA hydratase/carnithine racemase